MNMENYENHIEQLLPGYCEGMLTTEENHRVEEWMKQSEENRRMVKQIHTLYLAAGTKVAMEKVDTEKALAKVSRKLWPQKPGIHNTLLWIQRIAAILFIPLLITYIIQTGKTEPVPIRQMEVRTNPGMTTTVNLPDGTVAYLNSETTLTYPSMFTGNSREVSLDGEAYFMVQKDQEKKFIVSTPHQSGIEVLGTHFNIDAYAADNHISTTLVEGKVKFNYNNNNQTRSITLAPGDKLIYDVESAKTTLMKTTGESESAWKDGKIVFANTAMKDALRMLEKRYNVEFTVKNAKLLDNSFTGTFTHQRLERILEYFKVSSKINWKYIDSADINKEKIEIEIY